MGSPRCDRAYTVYRRANVTSCGCPQCTVRLRWKRSIHVHLVGAVHTSAPRTMRAYRLCSPRCDALKRGSARWYLGPAHVEGHRTEPRGRSPAFRSTRTSLTKARPQCPAQDLKKKKRESHRREREVPLQLRPAADPRELYWPVCRSFSSGRRSVSRTTSPSACSIAANLAHGSRVGRRRLDLRHHSRY